VSGSGIEVPQLNSKAARGGMTRKQWKENGGDLACLAIPHNKALRGGLTRGQWIKANTMVVKGDDFDEEDCEEEGPVWDNRNALPRHRTARGGPIRAKLLPREEAKHAIDTLMETMKEEQMRDGVDEDVNISAMNEEGFGEDAGLVLDENDLPRSNGARGRPLHNIWFKRQALAQARPAANSLMEGCEGGKFMDGPGVDAGIGAVKEENYGEEEFRDGGSWGERAQKDEEMWDEEAGEIGYRWNEDEDENDYEYEYAMLKIKREDSV
jgi:hypothetical protein